MPWEVFDYEGAGNGLSLCDLINTFPPKSRLCGVPALFALNLNKAPMNPSMCGSDRFLPLELTGMDAQHFLDKGCDDVPGGIEPYEGGGPAASNYDVRDNLINNWGWVRSNNTTQTCWRCKFKKTVITVRFTEKGVHISPLTFITKEVGVCGAGMAPAVTDSFGTPQTQPYTTRKSRISVNGVPRDWTDEASGGDVGDTPEGSWQSGGLLVTNTKPIQDDLMGSRSRGIFGANLGGFCAGGANGDVTFELVATQVLGTTNCDDPTCKSGPVEISDTGGLFDGLGPGRDEAIDKELALLRGQDLDEMRAELQDIQNKIRAARAAGRKIETVIGVLTTQNYPAVGALFLGEMASAAEEGGYEGLSDFCSTVGSLIDFFADGVSTPITDAVVNIASVFTYIKDALSHLNGCQLESLMNNMVQPFPRDKFCRLVRAAQSLSSSKFNESVKNFNSNHLDDKDLRDDILGDDRGSIIDKFNDSLVK